MRYTYLILITLLTGCGCGGGSDSAQECRNRGGSWVTEGNQTGCVLVNPLPPQQDRQGG